MATLKTGWIKKGADKLYAWSHAKACRYGLDGNGNVETVHDKIEDINDNLANIPKCKIYNTWDLYAPQSDYVIDFAYEEYKSHPNMHNTTTNQSQIVAPISGLYTVVGQVVFSANANGCRQAVIMKNGTEKIAYQLLQSVSVSSVVTTMQVSALVYLNAGDYVELITYQNSGTESLLITGGRNNSWLSVARIGG